MQNVAAAPVHPALSIVIPAYNVAPYIRQAVLSALDQSFDDTEIIVVDDGSADATTEILAAIAGERRDERLHILHQANAGLSGARNTGILAARGHFIGFLDGDDVWLPEKAARHLHLMRGDPGIGISFSHSEYITESGNPTGAYLRADKPHPTLHDMIRRNHVGNGSNAIVRRDCFDRAGLFRPELRACEDYELWCRILHRTRYRAVAIPQVLTQYRMRLTSLSYDHRKFVRQADAAMHYLRAAMPAVPAEIFAAGHAEHYRIAAWKAASTGSHAAGARLLLRAMRLRPSLLLTDRRAAATGVWLMLPSAARRMLAPRLGVGG